MDTQRVSVLETKLKDEFFNRLEEYRGEYGSFADTVFQMMESYVNERDPEKRAAECGAIFRVISDNYSFVKSRAGLLICDLIDPSLYKEYNT